MRLFVNTEKLLSQKTEEGVKNALGTICDYAIYTAAYPVTDTGAYIKSFSLGLASSPGGRSFSSANLPRQQDKSSKANEARVALQCDIESLNIKPQLKSGQDFQLSLRNGAPHALDVEDGKNWQRDGYHVFAKIRSEFR